MHEIKLRNGFTLRKSAFEAKYYYGKPGILMNMIDRNGAERLREPARTYVLEGIAKLDETNK